MLVLGSFPSVKSLQFGCYYGHPANHFWSLLQAAWGQVAPSEPAGRHSWVLSHGLGIWDSIGSCRRKGSLDQAIRDEEPNDLPAFIHSHHSLARIICNGSLSARVFKRSMEAAGFPLEAAAPALAGAFLLRFGTRSIRVLCLPSTSPIPTKAYRRAEDKLPIWKEALAGS